MTPLLLLLLLHLSLLAVVASALPAPSALPLRQVFHPSLLRQHLSFSSEEQEEGQQREEGKQWDLLQSLVSSHYAHSLETPSQPLPQLFCGPDGPRQQLKRFQDEAEEVLGGRLVHLAHVSASGDDVCLLLLASAQDIALLLPYATADTGEDWTFSPIPYLFKIHHNVVEHVAQEEPFMTSVSPFPSHLPMQDTKNVPRGESLQLVIQFFPGVMFSKAAWDALLGSWSHQTSASENFQKHLSFIKQVTSPVASSEPLHSWEALRQKHTRGDVDTFDHCKLPSSAQVKFDVPEEADSSSRGGGAVARIVDLSGWTTKEGSSSSAYCLLKFIEVLSAHDAVLSISINSRPVALNYDVRGISQGGEPTNTPFSDVGLLGTGQVVGVADSGLDDKSCFFWDNSNYYSSPYTTRQGYGSTSVEYERRKVVQYTAYADAYDAAAGHGTHVVGTIVGNSISSDFSRANGVAPGAKVAFYDIQRESQSYLDMPSLASSVFPTMYLAGARVLSNSWGSPGSDTYVDSSYDVDSYTFNNPDVLVVYASGNSGAYGTGSAFSPCASKNALCVGSVDSRNDGDDGVVASSRVSYFSSQGPTGDGRIKPDVVAPGFKVVSALSGGKSGGDKFCGVYETFGTSMATPVVSGGALVLREYFMTLWGSLCLASYSYCKSFEPSGYLLKAVIIHSGEPVSAYSQSEFDSKTDIASHSLGTTPDSLQGYGSVNLNAFVPVNAKQMSSQDLYVVDAFNAAGRNTATLVASVHSTKRPLKVTLVWYDMPSTVGNTENLLIVNLNLVVTSPSGIVHYGNGVNGDSLNPQEQVYIPSPEKGSYDVSVTNVGYISANCALVITCAGVVTSELALSSSDEVSLDSAASFQLNPEENVNPDLSVVGVDYSLDDDLTAATVASPLFFNFDVVKSYTIHHTLSAQQKVLLKTFEMPDSSLALFSIDLSLDAHFCSGSEAFIFALIVVTPNGEIIQLGGYNEYSSLDRLWQRMSPVQWTAASAPPDGGLYWKHTRYIVDLEVEQAGPYEIYIQLLHDSWADTEYFGNVKLNFVDAATALNRSKSTTGFFSSLGAVGAGFIIFALVAVAVFGIFVVHRKRKELQPKGVAGEKNSYKKKKKKISIRAPRATKTEDEDAPWSNLSGLLSDMNSVSSNDVENPIAESAISREKTKVVRHKRYMSAKNSDV